MFVTVETFLTQQLVAWADLLAAIGNRRFGISGRTVRSEPETTHSEAS